VPPYMSTQQDRLVSRYRYLFKLPDAKVIALIYVSTIASIAYILALDTGILPLILLSSYVSCIVDLAVLYLNKYDPILRVRRILALSSLSNMILTLYFLGAVLTVGKSAGMYAIQASLCIAVYLRTLVIWSISKAKSVWKAMISLQPTILYYSATVWIYPLSLAPIAWSLLGFTLSLTTLRIVEYTGVRVTGLSFPRFFHGFLLCWMEDDPNLLEEILDCYGLQFKARIAILLFKTSSKIYAVAIPFIHSGPFLKVGSSYLSSKLKSMLESIQNIECAAVLHGASTHENDLTSSRYYEKIFDAISKSISGIDFKPVGISNIVEMYENNLRCIGHLFDNIALLSFTRAPRSTEDIPLSLQEEFSEVSRRVGLEAIYLIDCHNSIELNSHTTDGCPSESIRKLALKMIDTLKEAELHPASMSITSHSIKGYGIADGIGPGGVTMILFKVRDRLEGYLVFDSNNILPTLRESIVSALKSIGLSYVEVFTTDTHAVTGIVTGRGYKPLGEAIPFEDILASSIEVFKKAEAALEPIEGFGHTEVEVDGLKIIGENFLRNTDRLIDTCLNYAKKLIASSIASINILILLYVILLA
jgi:predicted neutral ceramidase superfamily lipid hydrolase